MTFSRSLNERNGLIFGDSTKLEKAGFYYCIDLLVKLKGGIKYHTKIFDMGFNKDGQVAETAGSHFDGVRGAKYENLLSFS